MNIHDTIRLYAGGPGSGPHAGWSDGKAKDKYEKLMRLANNNPNANEAAMARKAAERIKQAFGLEDHTQEAPAQTTKYPAGSVGDFLNRKARRNADAPVKFYGFHSVPVGVVMAKTKTEQINMLRQMGNNRLANKIAQGLYDEPMRAAQQYNPKLGTCDNHMGQHKKQKDCKWWQTIAPPRGIV